MRVAFLHVGYRDCPGAGSHRTRGGHRGRGRDLDARRVELRASETDKHPARDSRPPGGYHDDDFPSLRG